MTLRVLAILGLILPLSSASLAQERDEVGILLLQLDSDEVVQREEAMAALIRMGKVIRGRLEREMHRTGSGEVRARLSHVIGAFEVPSDGGKLSNGLKVVLTAEKKVLRIDEPFTLKAAIWNATAQPMNVYVGYSTGGVNLVNGSAYDIAAPSQKQGAKPQWNVGFCGTGAGPVFISIPPYSSKAFTSTAVLSSNKGKLQYRFGKNGWLSIAAPEADLHRFRAVVKTGERQGARIQDTPFGAARSADKAPLDRSLPVWMGRAESNKLQIRVEK